MSRLAVFGSFEPDSGQLTCAGDSSSVTITVIDSINILLEVDLDGDSLADSMINETWTSI